jgi:EpsI family protein
MIARMFIVGAMLVFSSWAVRAVGHGTPVALRQPFSQFPDRLATWQGEDERFTARIEEKLGVTDYLSKFYRDGSGQFIHLYVGYYASQQHGETIHSPKNCLPGNGWYIAKKETATVNAPPYLPFEVNSFTVENGIDRQIVLYWYQQAGGRLITNEYLGRVHLVLDSLTKKRSDAAFVRISIPFDDDEATAEQAGLEFLKDAYPAIMRFLPHDVATNAS